MSSGGITEVALMPTKAGSNVRDSSTPEGRIVQDALATVSGQPGCQRVYFGVEEEDLSLMRWFLDWDSVDDHKNFMASDDYRPFLQNLGSIMSGAPTLFHVPFTPHPAQHVLSDTNSPVTEIIQFYIDPSTENSAIEGPIKKFITILEDAMKDVPEYKGSAGGFADEKVHNAKAGAECKVYVALIGWESVEAHKTNAAKPALKDNVHLLTGLPGLKVMSVTHAKLTEANAGIGGALPASASAQEEILNPQDPGQGAPKTKSDGSTTKHDDALRGAAGQVHKEREGRGPYHHSGGPNHGN